MHAEMSVVEVEARHAAVIRGRIPLREIPGGVMPLVRRVWAFLQDGGAPGHGHNVWIYHHRPDGQVDVEVGVEVDAPFAGQGDVVPTETPAGRAARAVYYGDYAGLPEVHRALQSWCAARGLTATGDHWEAYGDAHDDPAQRRTDVYHLLAAR